MELVQLMNNILPFKKSIENIFKTMREVDHLDKDRTSNLKKISLKLITLKQILGEISQTKSTPQAISDWLSEYQQTIKATIKEDQNRFGVELEKALQEEGIELGGQYPELKAGLFTIGVDFDKEKVNIWYGPQQENLGQCSLSVKEVVAKIKDIRSHIGSQVGEEEFLKYLQDSASRSMGKDYEEAAPLAKILIELVFLIQSSKFRRDPKKENFKSYGRADFSYDLFRTRKAQHRILDKKKLHLIVATRGLTQKREDFLWVPEDLKGKGTAYSHLEFREVKE